MKLYKILSAGDEDTLADYVEQALNEQWELAGPMVVASKDTMMESGTRFYQPIIRTRLDRPGLADPGYLAYREGEKDDTGVSSFGGVTEGEMP